uniref:Fucosyltransferase N-terminal domain-containing protein n=1 Tax=Romanomermis culicivorax TaxID=13658 RepID=A0A915JTB3_ROMCU
MHPVQSWYVRRLKLFLPIYIGLIFVVAHFYGWRLFNNQRPVDRREVELPKRLNYVQIVGDDDQSLPLNFQTFKFNFDPSKILNSTSKFKIIGTESDDFNAGNLDACPDWRCKIVQMKVTDDVVSTSVDAIVVKGLDPSPWKRRPDQYVVFFSQESPANWLSTTKEPSMFNLTMGYR